MATKGRRLLVALKVGKDVVQVLDEAHECAGFLGLAAQGTMLGFKHGLAGAQASGHHLQFVPTTKGGRKFGLLCNVEVAHDFTFYHTGR